MANTTYPSVSINAMELTPCIVKFKKPGEATYTDLGGTLGNVKVKVQYKQAQIKADQFGDTDLNSKVSGFMATVETELTQIKDFEQIKVLFPFATKVQQQITVTMPIASPGVVSSVAPHGFVAGDAVVFAVTGGSLPTGVVAGTTYYVISSGLTANDFEISATPGGSAINFTTAGTGTITVGGGAAEAIQWNTNVGDDALSNAGELVLHPQSSSSTDVSHDWTFYVACATAESEFTYSPTEQMKGKIVWKIYPDLSVSPARFCRYGDNTL